MTKQRKFREYKEILKERLQDDAELAAMYLNEAIKSGEKSILLIALRDVLEARGNIKAFAKEADLPRQSIYRMLSEDGNPTLEKFIAIYETMGLKIQFLPA
jgi:probable addiction module antidote protein